MALPAADELCVCDLAWIADRAETLLGLHLRALRERASQALPIGRRSLAR